MELLAEVPQKEDRSTGPVQTVVRPAVQNPPIRRCEWMPGWVRMAPLIRLMLMPVRHLWMPGALQGLRPLK